MNHSYVNGPVPAATTLNDVVAGGVMVLFVGCVLMEGGVHDDDTVIVAVLLFTGEPHCPVTRTQYDVVTAGERLLECGAVRSRGRRSLPVSPMNHSYVKGPVPAATTLNDVVAGGVMDLVSRDAC